MPIVESLEGDLLESGADILVDLNNCVGVSGAGLAKAFKEKFPGHYQAYLLACASSGSGRPRPGTSRVILSKVYQVMINSDKYVLKVPRTVSMFTKDHWKNPTKLEWVDTALQDLRGIVTTKGDPWWEYDSFYYLPSVALAHPGCGNGGLEKSQVRPLIDKHLGDLPNKIFLFG